jgi:uncharacterized protein (UPF0548 family)
MRIPSGVTDQYIYFVAVDATDLKTRETGLSSFTVYRSRNGGAAAAYTTPTVNETDATNMPGVYELLLDEDMTIDAGDDSQEVCLHITHASMAPVTRTFELYRSLNEAAVRSAVGLASANLDTQLSTIDTVVDAILVDTGTTLDARIPAALVSGRMDASVGAMAANVMTAAAAASDLTTELQSGLATAAALTTVDGIVDDIKQMLGHKTTIATLASQTSFTLTAGSADDNAYNGWGAYVVDQSTATQLCLGVVSDYTGSTKTVTLTEDPAIFTMATGDTIILLPGKLTDVVSADLRKVMGNAFTGATKPYDTTA